MKFLQIDKACYPHHHKVCLLSCVIEQAFREVLHTGFDFSLSSSSKFMASNMVQGCIFHYIMQKRGTEK